MLPSSGAPGRARVLPSSGAPGRARVLLWFGLIVTAAATDCVVSDWNDAYSTIENGFALPTLLFRLVLTVLSFYSDMITAP